MRGQNIVSAVNGAALAFVVLLFFGLLMLVTHLGAFDSFSFGFRQLGTMIFSKDPRREGTFADYREAKRVKRDNSSFSFFSMMAGSLVYGILLIVLEIIYHAKF